MGKGLLRWLSHGRMPIVSAIGAVALGGLTVMPAAASSGSNTTREISASGTTSLSDVGLGSAGLQNPEIAQGAVDAEGGAGGPASVPTLTVDRSQTRGKSGEGTVRANPRRRDQTLAS